MSDPSTLPEWVEHCHTQAAAWRAYATRARLNAAEHRDTAGGTLGDLARAARVDLAAEWDVEADRATSYADAWLATHRLLSAASRRWPAEVAGDDALAECAGQLAAHLPTAPTTEEPTR